jgi:hypothetical protein
MEDFGIFNWMLMHSWVFSEKPCHLPNDPKRIAWLLRIDYQLIINCLSKYKKWVVTDDNQYIFNPRLLSIYKGLCDKSSVYSANRKGKKNKKLKKISIDNQLIINSKSIEQQADNDNDNDNGLVSTREDIPKQEDASSSKGDCKGEAPEPSKTWRTNFEIYLGMVQAALEQIIGNKQEMEKQRQYYPGVDIKLSLEKSAHNYWGTEAGWKNKKGKRSKDIDMYMTLINGINKSKVFLPRNDFGRKDLTREDIQQSLSWIPPEMRT